MEKHRTYRRTKFDSKTFFAVHKEFYSLASSKISYQALEVSSGDESWHYNTIEEFLAAVDSGWGKLQMVAETALKMNVIPIITEGVVIQVGAPTREKIEQVFSIFEANAVRCRIPEPPKPPPPVLKVFIGHGRDTQWKDLKDHLHEKHGYAVEAYEIGSRAGHSIRDILERMLAGSSFALLVMTGEDEMKDGQMRARQNVVHEAGLFQGRLGFSRAIILLEEGTEEFSNNAGLQHIQFAKGNIKSTFGDVLAALAAHKVKK